MDINQKLEKVAKSIMRFNEYHCKSLPLCAAENIISPFSKLPLNGDFQERYIMGNAYSYNGENNFVGSEYLLPFYEMIKEECLLLFGAKYSDARTLTGMNCLTTLLMSLTSINENILILGDEWGGHASVKEVCIRLGLNVFYLPYDLKNYDLDYKKLNQFLLTHKIKYILLAPSDIIFPLNVNNINLDETILLYDVSQIFGLIASGIITNPLYIGDNVVIFGGTHKTLPGPASGLILTNNESIHAKLEKNINPKYLRNTQMNQTISLLLTLLEVECYGKEYGTNIILASNKLAECLEHKSFCVAKKNFEYSKTHQIFIECDKATMERIYFNACRFGITLNKKKKKLFHGFGIRLGTQEIVRYRWNDAEFSIIGEVLHLISQQNLDIEKMSDLLRQLPPKVIHYTFPAETVQRLQTIFDLFNKLHKN